MPEERTPVKNYDINSIVDLVVKIETRRPPSLAQYQGMVQYFEEMQLAMEVVQEYKKRDHVWDPETMEQDKVYLCALYASMSVMVGYLQGESARAESARKIARSNYVLDIKRAKEQVLTDKSGFCKLTETEIDHAARSMCGEENEMARSAETVSRIISNAWYAISNFVDVLKSATYRANKEERQS
jgi:hypothetical protein